MAQITPGTIQGSTSQLVRTVTGAPVVADSATINDTNFPPTSDVPCTGWRTVTFTVKLTGGSSPTVTLQFLLRMTEATPFWGLGETTVPLVDGATYEVAVNGREVYPRIAAVSGSPTRVDIHAAGGDPFAYGGKIQH